MGRKGETTPRVVAWCLLTAVVAGCASAGRARPGLETPPDTRTDEAPARDGGAGDDRGPRTRPPEPLVGGCGPAPADLVARYILPYPAGEAFTLTQGNCGAASHDGRFRYSFDFEMPIGTPVIAARDGVVYTVRADRPDGSGRVGDENFVILDHGDGEFSRYIHLTRGGAFVLRGDLVSRGDTIALSGHSGRSAFPHLHFDVSVGCRRGPCRTVPSAFLNADSAIPDVRRSYDAGAFASAGRGAR